MNRLIYTMISIILFCQGCGKSEEHLRCEKAFKEYYGRFLAAALTAAAFGTVDATALNVTSLEVSKYKILNEIKVSDSLYILRQKAEEKYRESLKINKEWMNLCKKKFDNAVENYFKERKKAEEYKAAFEASGCRYGFDPYYQAILNRPEKTEEDLKRTHLKNPHSSYSRYISTKAHIEDMVTQKEKFIDNWFKEIAYYKTMDANKVLGKYVEVTYYINGEKDNKQKIWLVFNNNLTKVLGEIK